MSGFIPTPADGWPSIAAMLDGKEWPEAAAVTDLRWYIDARGGWLAARGLEPTAEALVKGLPSRAALAKRWKWSDWAVRNLLSYPGMWWDNSRWGEPSREPRHPGRHSRRHDGDERTPGSDGNPPGSAARPARTSPAELHLSVDPPSPSPSPSPLPEKTDVAPAGEGGQLNLIAGGSGEVKPAGKAKAPKADRYEEAARYFGQIVHLQINRRPSFGPDRKTKLGQKLERAVRQDAELVLDAMRYVAEGKGERAVFLRTEYAANITVETVLRHAEEYAELWRAERDPEHRPPTPGQAGLAKRGPALSAEERQRIADDFALNGFGGE